MVRSSQDDGLIERNCVIRVIGQMPSDVGILWCFRRKIYLFIYLFHLRQHTILLKSAIIKSKTALQL